MKNSFAKKTILAAFVIMGAMQASAFECTIWRFPGDSEMDLDDKSKIVFRGEVINGSRADGGDVLIIPENITAERGITVLPTAKLGATLLSDDVVIVSLMPNKTRVLLYEARKRVAASSRYGGSTEYFDFERRQVISCRSSMR